VFVEDAALARCLIFASGREEFERGILAGHGQLGALGVRVGFGSRAA
jgi:hypothetical protein